MLTRTENRTTNHVWVSELQYSLDGGLTWWPSTPTPLHGNVSTNASVIQAEVTDRSLFCAPDLRVNLACWNGAGTARESASVWASLVLTLLS